MYHELVCANILTLEIEGGYGETIFPNIEKLLYASTDFQSALVAVLPKAAKSFTSLVDWLLVEADKDCAPAWYRWRWEDGPALKDTPGFSEVKRLRLEKKMLLLLGAAHTMWKNNTLRTWNKVRARYVERLRRSA